MVKQTDNERAYKALLKKHTKAAIAEIAGITRQGVGKWTQVPPQYVTKISEATGIPKQEILPDPY